MVQPPASTPDKPQRMGPIDGSHTARPAQQCTGAGGGNAEAMPIIGIKVAGRVLLMCQACKGSGISRAPAWNLMARMMHAEGKRALRLETVSTPAHRRNVTSAWPIALTPFQSV